MNTHKYNAYTQVVDEYWEQRGNDLVSMIVIIGSSMLILVEAQLSN